MPMSYKVGETLLRMTFLDQFEPLSPVPQLDVGLFLDPVDGDGVGTEAAGGGYQRQAVGANQWSIIQPTIADWQAQNIQLIDFGVATADIGIIVSYGIFDGPTGELYYMQTLDSPIDYSMGERVMFNPGELIVRAVST